MKQTYKPPKSMGKQKEIHQAFQENIQDTRKYPWEVSVMNRQNLVLDSNSQEQIN